MATPRMCQWCCESRIIVGRRLCSVCYHYHAYRGSLGQFRVQRQYRAHGAALLAESLQNGMTIDQIAQREQVSRHVITNRARKWLGGARRIRQGIIAVRPLQGVAALLGVPKLLVREWISQGYLAAHRGSGHRHLHSTVRGRVFLVADCDLQEALTQRETWPRLDLTRMDPDWRTVVVEAQAASPGRWYTLDAVAAHWHYSPHTVRGWINEGWTVERIRVRFQWYVWGTKVHPPKPPGST